jgi:two-component system, chemotaxis family, protein-glutamate methylesterase/glutaminase
VAFDHIVVMGASAGGLEPLKTVIGALPADFPAPIFVVMHLAAHGPSVLPAIFTAASGKLKAVHPRDGDPIVPGRIYCAPPNCHLLAERDTVAVKHGPLENRFRPSIDALFRSAAYNHGAKTIGVVFSGLLHDGTSGLWTIKRLGGTTIVQEPGESQFNSMPLSALNQVEVDYCLPAREIGDRLVRLTREPPARKTAAITDDERRRLDAEVRIASGEYVFTKERFAQGDVSPYTCPDCHGSLARIEEGGVARFRCHTGHAFSTSALLSAISDTVEDSLIDTVRALEEGVLLLEDIAREVGATRGPAAAAPFLEKAAEAQTRAKILHDVAMRRASLAADAAPDDGASAESGAAG